MNTKMLNVLQKFNLQQAFPNFEREKITPDIVCRLSTHEMEILGVYSRADMMKLRTECVKYGTSAPNKINSECGPPKFQSLF